MKFSPVVASLLLIACGGSTPATPVSDAGPADSTADTAPRGDAASDGSGGDAGVDPSGPPSLFAFSAFNDGTASATAGFFASAHTYNCPVQIVGACLVYATCSGGLKYTTTPVDPGALTVGGGAPAVSLPLNKKQDVFATTGSVTNAGKSFKAGDTVTFTGAGGVVPAFQETLAYPGLPSILTPPSGATIDPTTDAPMTFADAVGVDELLVAATGPSASAICDFHVTGAAGSVSIPASALAKLGTGSGNLSVTAQATKLVTEGTFPTTFYAGSLALNAAKTGIYLATVTFK